MNSTKKYSGIHISPKYTNLVFITNKENKKPKQKLDDVDHVRLQSPQVHFLFVKY